MQLTNLLFSCFAAKLKSQLHFLAFTALFFKINAYICSVFPNPKPTRQMGKVGLLHYGIAFTRLFLDNLKLRNFLTCSRTQQRRCSWVCYTRTPLASGPIGLGARAAYVYIQAWASVLLVLTGWAMRRPQIVERVTYGSTLLFVL